MSELQHPVLAPYYRARRVAGGGGLVLELDGLTWESEHPTLESAQAHALALNEWLDARPDPARVAPFFSSELERPAPTAFELMRIIDRLTAPEELAYRYMLEHAAREYAAG